MHFLTQNKTFFHKKQNSRRVNKHFRSFDRKILKDDKILSQENIENFTNSRKQIFRH